MNHLISEWALEELDHAVAYYTAEKPGLGDEFLSEFKDTLQRIIDFPEAWGLVSKNVRLCQFKRFPYGIVYFVKDEIIRIVAVMFLQRRPGYWKKRLKKMDF